jgi:hypothetical protein
MKLIQDNKVEVDGRKRIVREIQYDPYQQLFFMFLYTE